MRPYIPLALLVLAAIPVVPTAASSPVDCLTVTSDEFISCILPPCTNVQPCGPVDTCSSLFLDTEHCNYLLCVSADDLAPVCVPDHFACSLESCPPVCVDGVPGEECNNDSTACVGFPGLLAPLCFRGPCADGCVIDPQLPDWPGVCVAGVTAPSCWREGVVCVGLTPSSVPVCVYRPGSFPILHLP